MTGQSPVKLLLRYEPRHTIPGVEKQCYNRALIRAREHDKKNKQSIKSQYDLVHRVKDVQLREGDIVLQRQERKDKFTAKFDHKPYRVLSIKGNAAVVERDGVKYRRNISCLKKVRGDFGLVQGDSGVEDEGSWCIDQELQGNGEAEELVDDRWEYPVQDLRYEEPENVVNQNEGELGGMQELELGGGQIPGGVRRSDRVRNKPTWHEPYEITFK